MTEIQQIPIVDKLFFQISMSKMLIKDSQKNKKIKKKTHKKFKCIKNLIKYN